MGTHDEQLSLEERCTITRLLADGGSIRDIAASMDRAPSTIARELKRTRGTQVGEAPADAADQAWARRWRGSRLARQPALQQAVLSRLARGWSPEQVAGRLAHDNASLRISHASIDRCIDAQIRRTKDCAWRQYLPRAKFKRGYRGRKGGSSVRPIKDRVPIADRPASIETRRRPGHGETEDLLFRHQGQARARRARADLAAGLNRPTTQPAGGAHREPVDRVVGGAAPPQLRRTLTQDNGTEFAEHHTIRDALGIKTFFWHPHSPWQKGGVENANGRLRCFLPKTTHLRAISHQHIAAIAQACNNTPRTCLGFKTPRRGIPSPPVALQL